MLATKETFSNLLPFPSGGCQKSGDLEASARNYRVAILQPVISDYRVPFYKQLQIRLSDLGIELRLFASDPENQTFLRNGIDALSFANRVHRKSVYGIGYWQGWPNKLAKFDAVILQAITSGNFDSIACRVSSDVPLSQTTGWFSSDCNDKHCKQAVNCAVRLKVGIRTNITVARRDCQRIPNSPTAPFSEIRIACRVPAILASK